MSHKTRGQEITIRIAVDGVAQAGSMIKLTDFTATPRTDLNEDDYLGEQETDIDIQHHGWDLGFTVDTIDGKALDLVEEIIGREQIHAVHPNITITVMYAFREPGEPGRIVAYRNVYLKQDEEGMGGRKEKVKGKFSGKCKRRSVIEP